jgi:hypothetical protein
MLDSSQFAYPLNRCFAYLKLQRYDIHSDFSCDNDTYCERHRWEEAEKDADTVLSLKHGQIKAFYRRSLARKGRGKFADARQGTARLADFIPCITDSGHW